MLFLFFYTKIVGNNLNVRFFVILKFVNFFCGCLDFLTYALLESVCTVFKNQSGAVIVADSLFARIDWIFIWAVRKNSSIRRGMFARGLAGFRRG